MNYLSLVLFFESVLWLKAELEGGNLMEVHNVELQISAVKPEQYPEQG